MEAKITTYLNNAKSAFTFVFDDGCYYDSTMDAKCTETFFQKMSEKLQNIYNP